jgi:hypothetical protein
MSVFGGSKPDEFIYQAELCLSTPGMGWGWKIRDGWHLPPPRSGWAGLGCDGKYHGKKKKPFKKCHRPSAFGRGEAGPHSGTPPSLGGGAELEKLAGWQPPPKGVPAAKQSSAINPKPYKNSVKNVFFYYLRVIKAVPE